jgi:4-hydroxy-tetrahydrodipicolinate reductase
VDAVSRTHVQRILGDVLAEPRLTCPVYATAQQALAHPCDVFFEYTKPEVAKANIIAAVQRGLDSVLDVV